MGHGGLNGLDTGRGGVFTGFCVIVIEIRRSNCPSVVLKTFIEET